MHLACVREKIGNLTVIVDSIKLYGTQYCLHKDLYVFDDMIVKLKIGKYSIGLQVLQLLIIFVKMFV